MMSPGYIFELSSGRFVTYLYDMHHKFYFVETRLHSWEFFNLLNVVSNEGLRMKQFQALFSCNCVALRSWIAQALPRKHLVDMLKIEQNLLDGVVWYYISLQLSPTDRDKYKTLREQKLEQQKSNSSK